MLRREQRRLAFRKRSRRIVSDELQFIVDATSHSLTDIGKFTLFGSGKSKGNDKREFYRTSPTSTTASERFLKTCLCPYAPWWPAGFPHPSQMRRSLLPLLFLAKAELRRCKQEQA